MKNVMRFKNGFSQLFILLGMFLVAVSLPLVTSLVQNSQENRGRATSDSSYSSGDECSYGTESSCIGDYLYCCSYNPDTGSMTWNGCGICKNGVHVTPTPVVKFNSGDECTSGSSDICATNGYEYCCSYNPDTGTTTWNSCGTCDGGTSTIKVSTSLMTDDGYLLCKDGDAYRFDNESSGWVYFTDCDGNGCSGGVCGDLTKPYLPPGVDLSRYQTEIEAVIANNGGYGSRTAIAAVALYMAEDFPYNIAYNGKAGEEYDRYQLLSGFLNKYDETYISYLGKEKTYEINENNDNVVLKDSKGRTVEGFNCLTFIEWIYRTVGYDVGLSDSKQSLESNDKNSLSTVVIDGVETEIATSEWITLSGYKSEKEYKLEEDIVIEPGDLIYKNSDGSTHVAVIVDVDYVTNTVEIVQMSTSGISTQYIDLVSLQPLPGGTARLLTEFNFYSSNDTFFDVYSGDVTKTLNAKLDGLGEENLTDES